MDVIVLIGRILFAALFIGSAFGHLSQSEGMGQYAKSKGVPAARVVVILSGLLILAGGLSVLLGIWADLGALALVVFLVPTALDHPRVLEGDRPTEQADGDGAVPKGPRPGRRGPHALRVLRLRRRRPRADHHRTGHSASTQRHRPLWVSGHAAGDAHPDRRARLAPAGPQQERYAHTFVHCVSAPGLSNRPAAAGVARSRPAGPARRAAPAGPRDGHGHSRQAELGNGSADPGFTTAAVHRRGRTRRSVRRPEA